ncbi:MAG: hypothetical protein A2V70_12450 [Planctomycetes bacterium RBG_13_63_9]|nr:MAG: hypothetical protein A2V70_12450 [Planctomycetes bacterium RBG_13_63_9]
MSLMIVLSLAPAAGAADDVLIADFEGPDYGGWTVTGEAFGPGPAQGTLPNQMSVSGFEGKGLVNSFHKGDGSTGTLTSPPFPIERNYVNFLIGGGGHPGKACMNLLVDGQVVRTATGPNRQPGGTERLDRCSWDVGDLRGKTARIEIVDRVTGGWGHINIDQIVQSDKAKAALIVVDKLYQETYRPQFHFTATKNWLNDPNGMMFYKGEYHLFFQHNPEGIDWGNMTWGHAVSGDMIHWKQLEHAIHPDELGTIFSGSGVVDWINTAGFQTGDEAVLVCIYTSAGEFATPKVPFTQSIAYSNDRGKTWTKYEHNPVLGHIVGSNRDPKVIWHEPSKRWIMALYLDGNDFALFSSPNLKQWTRTCDVRMPGTSECPDFFELPVDGQTDNTKWVFWGANGNYLLGSFDGKEFRAQSELLRSEWGENWYAAQTFSDIPKSDGRRLQIAWMRGGEYPRMPFNQQMSVPCRLTLRTFPEGVRLCRQPVREIESIHSKHHRRSDTVLRPGENPLPGVSGDLFDVRAEIEIADAAAVGLKIRGEPVIYRAKEKTLCCRGKSAPLEPVAGRIRLQVLVDRTSLEIFASDGKIAMAFCLLPDPEDTSLEIFAQGGKATLRSLDVWELKSIWP